MKKKPESTGPQQPFQGMVRSFRGHILVQESRFGVQVRSWPRRRGPRSTPNQAVARTEFTAMSKAVSDMMACDQVAAREIAAGTSWTWRDVLSRALAMRLIDLQGDTFVDIQLALDGICATIGALLYRSAEGWVCLSPGDDGQVIAYDVASQAPVWVDPAATGMSQLTGDITAGPGAGSQVATLSNTGVTAGSYTTPNLTIDDKGRVTAAASNPSTPAITQLTGDVTAGPGSGSQPATLANTTVAAGAYHHATVTFDAKGRATAAANGAVADASNTGIVKPDNSTLLIASDGTMRGVSSSGGGLFNRNMTSPPTSAGTGLSTWLNQGGASVSDLANGIGIVAPMSVGGGLRVRYAPNPTGNYVRTALISITEDRANTQLSGIGFYDGSNKIELIHLHNDGSVKFERWNSPTSWNSTPATQAAWWAGFIWLQIELTSTQAIYRWSTTGDLWNTVQTVTKSGSFIGSSGYVNPLFSAYAEGSAGKGQNAMLLSWG